MGFINFRGFIVATVFLIMGYSGFAQCNNPYTSYPVTFDFEANDGGWTTGGTSSDWAWGHPSKPVISRAGVGQKCWITGGLTDTRYNSNERSWLQTPNCFDFTNVQYPYVEFNVFWETEKKYDGASFEYSTDNGSSWHNVGAAGSTDNCIQKNWFNYTPILNLPGTNDKDGWSGNVQPSQGSCQGGGGSGNWVIARHQLYSLAGESHVLFRFTFGSGSTCNDYDGFAIDQVVFSNTPPGPVITNIAHTDATCYGTATGSASAVVVDGFAPFTYKWVSGANTYAGASVSAIKAGNYGLSVTDNNSCTVNANFVIKEPSALLHSVTLTDAVCGSATGSATVVESGGTAPYSYAWSPNVSIGPSASSLAGGQYLLTVTDAGNCSDTANINIGFQGGVSAKISQSKNVSCNGANDGSASVEVTGPGPYTYSWLPSGGNEAVATNLAPGTYTVSVNNPIGCSDTVSVQITEPTVISTTVTSQNTTCGGSNGKINVAITGGQGAYTYLWTPGNFTTPDIEGLAAGTYTLAIKDAAGCFAGNTIIIGSSAGPQIAGIVHTDISCSGQNNGSAFADVNGGLLPYNYTWTNGSDSVTIDTLSNAAAGTYHLTVADATTCSTGADVVLTEPAALQLSVTTQPASCGLTNGSAIASVTGGTGPYTYAWSTGGSINSISDLAPATYNLTVTDANACTLTGNDIIVASVARLNISLGRDTAICPGNTLLLSPGTFAAYTWQDNTHTPTYSASRSGQYSVTVTDSTGCTAAASVKVEVNCTDIRFPQAFTPNGDAENETFGPLGTLSAISAYRLSIYNRWGQLVFGSTNPYQKWPGNFKGIAAATGTFAWFATYSFNGVVRKQKGTILLIR